MTMVTCEELKFLPAELENLIGEFAEFNHILDQIRDDKSETLRGVICLDDLNENQWGYVFAELNYSPAVLKTFGTNYHWNYISADWKLSEEFIREYQNHLDWMMVCIAQNLSEEFIEEFQEHIESFWWCIFDFQTLSFKFKAKWLHKMPAKCEDEEFAHEYPCK